MRTGRGDARIATARLAVLAVVVLTLVAATAALGGVALDALRSPVPVDLPTAVTAGAAGVSAALLGWLSLCVVLAGAERLRPRSTRLAAVPPVVVRRLVLALLGLTVVTAAVGTAAAEEPPSTAARALDPAWAQSSGETTSAPGAAADRPVDLDPGWTPSAPAPVPRHPPAVELLTGVTRQSSAPETDEVVVRRGDTLWDLAARALPPTATDAEIAEEWPRWYSANVAVIGADPDLLLPGQRLRVPAAEVLR